MFDSHLHVDFSTDSHMTITEAVKRAKDLNLGIVITEHMDFNYPVEGVFKFDPELYFKEFSAIRTDRVLLGVELGMHCDYCLENRQLVENYPFDYVLGSLHFLGNNDIFHAVTYEGKSKREVYTYYFENMLQNIKLHEYIDALGHIDYICRYARYEDTEIYYEEYSDVIDALLKTIIDKNIVLEINSRRLNNSSALKNLLSIYKRYKELGGQLVTLGSDAHCPEDIGSNFRAGVKLIKELNFKSVYFKERKLQYDIL
jgi:histidinol-phosphatase (PHP family)